MKNFIWTVLVIVGIIWVWNNMTVLAPDSKGRMKRTVRGSDIKKSIDSWAQPTGEKLEKWCEKIGDEWGLFVEE